MSCMLNNLLKIVSYLFLFSLLYSGNLDAITQYRSQSLRFVTQRSSLRPSLVLKTRSNIENLLIPIKKLKIRAKRSIRDERIDPVQIYLPTRPKDFNALVKDLAKRDDFKFVYQKLKEKMLEKGKGKSRVLVDLEISTLKKMKLRKVAELMSRRHHNVYVNGSNLGSHPSLKKELLDQVKPFLSPGSRMKLVRKIKEKRDIIVHKDLLPSFPRTMAKKYVVFRGPNCFHAALAFHAPNVTRLEGVNVKYEKGYHKAMINYDELWRAISRGFYEVDPSKSELKYGDMIVFFDIPKNNPKNVNFRWIRHTATYLFGNYTFSKGSKSPNTPYSVKTLDDEWTTWEKYTRHLGVRVFRRVESSSQRSMPRDLVDWVF